MNAAPDSDSELPISRCHDPLDLLLRTRLLDPPSHPSLLACLDHYEILDWIGSGGMGLVFLARSNRETLLEETSDFLDLPDKTEENSGREEISSEGELSKAATRGLVAIKLLRPELISNIEAADRFLLESRHMQNLFHPNILQVLEVCDRSKPASAKPSAMPVFRSRRPFFVTPYVKGGNLAKRIRDMGPLPRELVLTVARQIAAALCFVHGKGIVHRDLKPGNILLGTADHVFLADFGLARSFTNESIKDVRRSHCIGTSSYMSPALAAGEAEDTRGDIYAFGAILYEMLTGRAPYPERTPGETLQCILAGPPEPILRINPGAAENLVRVAEGAMARKVRDRYSTMTDVLADLERIGHGVSPQGPHGQEKGAVVVSRSKDRSRPLSAAMWSGFLVVVAGLFGLAFWYKAERLQVVGRHTLPGIIHWEESRLVEWNGSPPKELILTHHEELIVLSDMGPLARYDSLRNAFDRPFSLDLCWDMNNDQVDELFVHWNREDAMCLDVLNRQFKILKHFELKRNAQREIGDKERPASIRSERVLDLDEDGQRELLASVRVESSGIWRGLVCFNFEDSSERWSYPTLLNPEAVQVADLDGDGKSEVVVGGRRSPEAPPTGGGLLALSSQGQLLWEALIDQTSDVLCPMAVNLNPGKELEIIAWSPSPHAQLPKPSSSPLVYCLDHKGRLKARFKADAPLTGALVCRGIQKGQFLLVLSDANGQVYELGEDLALLSKRKLIDPSEGWLQLAACADINSDSRDELILTVQGHNHTSNLAPISVLVLNNSLDTISRLEMPKSFRGSQSPAVLVSDWDGNQEMEVLVLGVEVVALCLGGGR